MRVVRGTRNAAPLIASAIFYRHRSTTGVFDKTSQRSPLFADALGPSSPIKPGLGVCRGLAGSAGVDWESGVGINST